MSEPAVKVVKAVLDASTLLRGISSAKGPSGHLLDAFFDGAFDMVLSLDIIMEVEDVLHRGRMPARPPLTDDDRSETVTLLIDTAEMATGTYHLDLVPTDLKDNHVVSAAIETGAQYIVTEDKRDLLSLKVVRSVAIRLCRS